MASFSKLAALTGALALAGCAAAPPSGPHVVAMPGTGKSYEQFVADDNVCRQAAFAQSGVAPADQSGSNAAGTAIAGAALGAAAGAALGSASANLGGGAAVGGALGLLAGTAVGANGAQAAAGNAQFRFDTAYTQCMYAKGNQVPSTPPTTPYYTGGPVYGGPAVYGSFYGGYYGAPYHHRYWRPYP